MDVTPTSTTSQIIARLSVVNERLNKQKEVLDRNEAVIKGLQDTCKMMSNLLSEVQIQLECFQQGYADMTEEMEESLALAVTTAEFRALLSQELDPEDLLRTALEIMLAKIGPANIAVFLPDPKGDEFALGAYVNYSQPRGIVQSLLDEFCTLVGPRMIHENRTLYFPDPDAFCNWSGVREGFAKDSHALCLSCFGSHHTCQAVVMLYRNVNDMFTQEQLDILKAFSDVIGIQIECSVKVHHRGRDEWPEETDDDDEEDGMLRI